MQPEDLLKIGCNDIHWNRNWNGGWHEYWLPVKLDAEGAVWLYLSVRFDRNPNYPDGRDWMVYLCSPHYALGLEQIGTLEQFKQLHDLIAAPNCKGLKPDDQNPIFH